ncbi:MAG: trypsin-like peptidase domain-containing protein [bacterium]
MKTTTKIVLLILTSAVFQHQTAILAQTQSNPNPVPSLAQLSQSFEELSASVRPAVVQVFATGYSSVPVGGGTNASLLARQRSSGSGVILTPDGYIVTNAHVVSGARRVQVMLTRSVKNGTHRRSILKSKGKFTGAQIVGVDLETDLAVLKVQETGLAYLQLGDSDELRTGQLVLAFGSPLGLENSVTMGVISSIARQLRPEDPMIYVQTDAAINPGNSGGPLVNTDGQVVGINTFILTQSGGNEGLGFAAPSNIVKNVFQQIRRHGHVRRGIIGAYAQTITPTLASGLGLSKDWGVVIGDVYPDSPADKAGLKVGDVINTLDGKVMENGRQFDVNLYRRPIGQQVRLEVTRGSRNLVIAVPVMERDDDPGRFASMVTPDENLVPKLGILGIDLDEHIRKMLPHVRKKKGIVVAARSADAPHWEGGFYPGDVIYSINNKPVTNLAELRNSLKNLKPYQAVAAQVERQGQLMYIAFELE